MINLNETRLLAKKIPRVFNIPERIYNYIRPPFWLPQKESGGYEQIYIDKKMLFEKGHIGWAYIVQANEKLYRPGRLSYPAIIIYSFDKYFDDKLSELSSIASFLLSLKMEPDVPTELKIFKSIVANRFSLLFNRRLPNSISQGKMIFLTSIIIHRKHLPVNHLKAHWFPILSHPKKTSATIVFPSRYWEKSLVERWQEENV